MSFKITILGSSGALPAYGRNPSSQFIDIQNRHFLVDCGEGTQIQMQRHQVSRNRLHHIFISHLHGDHYLGLMGLLFSMHLHKRTADLHLYSHTGLNEIIMQHLKHANSALSYKIIFHRMKPHQAELLYEDEKITVTSIPLIHKIPCSGFLFREKQKPRRIIKETLPVNLTFQQLVDLKSGKDILDEHGEIQYTNVALTHEPKRSRSYAYCSDTAYNESILQQIESIDLLYHEATFMNEDAVKATETKHATAEQAAIIAQKANAKKLLLGHFSARYKDLNPLLVEAKNIFKDSYLAVEGQTFSIKE